MNQDPVYETQRELAQDLDLPSLARPYLQEAAKWAKRLSILGFIILGLFVLISIIAPLALSSTGRSVMNEFASVSNTVSIFKIAQAILCFFPIFFLYRFATQTQKAIKTHDNDSLVFGLQSLKSFFKFFGMVAIIVFSIYVVLYLFMGPLIL